MKTGTFNHSVEHKEYMRRIMKGRNTWSKGRVVSEETRKKMSDARKGIKYSNETLEKMKKPKSSSHKESLSKSRMGISPWNKGCITPQETRDKLSKSRKGKCLGKNNYSWKGGKLTIKQSIRGSVEYKAWRTSILQRDKYTCVLCGKIGGELNVDHFPKSFSEIVNGHNINCIEDAINCDELWSIENNRTLCIDCHKKTPNYLKGTRATS